MFWWIVADGGGTPDGGLIDDALGVVASEVVFDVHAVLAQIERSVVAVILDRQRRLGESPAHAEPRLSNRLSLPGRTSTGPTR